MDAANCPAGYASDHVMLYGNDFIPNSCEVPIALYVSLFTLLCVIRGSISMYQFKLWFDRERRLKAKTGKVRRRIPVIPLLSFSSFFTLVIFTILTSVNVANSSNGGPLFLLGLFYLPLSVSSIFTVAKIVRLGKQIVPLAKLKLDNSEHARHFVSLDQTTLLMKVVYLLDFWAVFIIPISVTVGLFIPVYETFQAAVMCYAFQDVLIGWGIGYQYQRVINAVKACQYNNQMSDTRAAEMAAVISRLRIQQIMLATGGPLVTILWVLNASRALLPYYWVVLIHFAVEVITTFFFVLSHTTTGGARKKKIGKFTGGGADETGQTAPAGTPLQESANPMASHQEQQQEAITPSTGLVN